MTAIKPERSRCWAGERYADFLSRPKIDEIGRSSVFHRHVYVDAGVSRGTPLRNRPRATLLNVVRPSEVVVAAKMDRTFRSAAAAFADDRELL